MQQMHEGARDDKTSYLREAEKRQAMKSPNIPLVGDKYSRTKYGAI